jgi:hypothetical protein
MSLLEASLKKYVFSPGDSHWRKYGESAYAELKNKLEETSEPEG